MLKPHELPFPPAGQQRPWDARLARRLVAPLKDSWVTPNHLTTIRLVVGCAAAAGFIPGTYGWSNIAALLLVLSNFLDHTDGELARMSGRTSRFGHVYDLASDALVTVLLFVAMGVGVGTTTGVPLSLIPVALGAVAGVAVTLIFFLRMRIESLHGKKATQQPSLVGFETEDVMYLLPLATLANALPSLLLTAAICAPLYAIWVSFEYRRLLRKEPADTFGLSD